MRGAPDPYTKWQERNPHYRYSPPETVVIDGRECVEIDGGVWSEIIRDGRMREAAAQKRGGHR